MSETPVVKAEKVTEYTTKQPKYKVMGSLPTRQLICAPSGSGKTVLISSLILDIYRGAFEKIFIFSPSIWVDAVWEPVKKYIKNEMKIEHTEEDPIYFAEPDFEALENIIETQHKIIKYMKSNNYKKLFQILIIVDDHADDEKFCKRSKMLNQLYIRGRHNAVSVITSTQKYRAIGNIIRINSTELIVFRLRNAADLEAIIDEVSALADKKTLMDIYNLATAEPYSFLYIKLNAKTKNDTFYIRFEKRIEIDDS